MIGIGSVVTMIVLILIASFLQVATEHLGGIGMLVTVPVAIFQAVGFVLVPLIISMIAVSHAERSYGATQRDTNLAFLVAAVLYVVHLPLVLLLLLLTGMTGWPWR